ncbi:MAG: DUF885 domain-containing protein [Bdellovibrionales bacterium]|nr:DUF885 domain-containing protein [Bdellovibrionales bacterium]
MPSALLLSILFVFTTLGCASTEMKGPAKSEADVKLEAAINRYAEANKRLDAFSAPYFNVLEDLDKFGDFLSPEMKVRRKANVETALKDISSIEASQLSRPQALAYRLFKADMEHDLKGFDFPFEYFAFDQMGNRFRQYIDDSSPELTSFPFKTRENFQAFVKRSEGFLPFVDRQITTLKDGAKAGYALNCVIAKSAIETYKDALEKDVKKNPFYRPVLNLPASLSKEDQDKLRSDFAMMITTRILPGFEKFDRFYKTEYLPKCRKSFGLKGLPNAAKLYAYQIRSNADLEMDPAAIHAIGLKEVARIRNEMQKAFSELGYSGSMKSNLKRITSDPQSYFTNVKDMFAAYDALRSAVNREVEKSFSLIPKTDFKMVESENPEDAAGSYRDPTEILPIGRFVVNAKNLKSTPRWGVNTLFIHEAIPGHHFHLALQYEMKDTLSEYQRKMFYSNAFTEGWALYAERWGREAGLLNDPAQMIGSLSDEMLRAVRLVVDTGIHHYGWSREKVIKYMTANLPSDARDIQIETDRYSVWPGQALGYKLGQLKILELRDQAQKRLGAKFNLKDFHKVVLENGTVSLPVLESNVEVWLKSNEGQATTM